MRRGVAVGACVLAAACGGQAPRQGAEPFVVKRAGFTGYYAGDGRLQKLVKDQDGDGRPEATILYRPDGKMQEAELDEDGDGVVDRWEYFNAQGVLERVGTARMKPGVADTWDALDAAGTTVVRREIDTNGDGKPDSAAPLPTLASPDEIDTNGNGKPDRRLVRDAAGAVIAIELDPDEDGHWERRAAQVVPSPGAPAPARATR